MLPQQRFRDLLLHAWKYSALYREIYTQHGIREPDLPFIQLEDLPVVSKADVMLRFDDAVTDPRLRREALAAWVKQDTNPLSLYLDEYLMLHSSGGSAIYSYVPYTLQTWRVMTATAAPAILPLHQDMHTPMRSAFYFASDGHFVSATNVSLASRSAHQVLRLSVFDPVEEVWARLNAFQPERLTGYASVIGWLAEWTLTGKLRIAPRAVLISGDRLTPYVKSLVQEAWHADIYNLYGACESLYMALQKPGSSSFEVFTELNILEVVDESQRMVQPGERGRVLLTSLIHTTLPFIRYDLSDYATLERAGFGATRLTSVDGKVYHDLPVRLADGTTGALQNNDLHRLQVAGVKKLQYVSHSPDEVEVRYEAPQDLDQPVATAVRQLLLLRAAVVRSIRVQRVARINNDAVTFKCADVVTPDRQQLHLVSLAAPVGREPKIVRTPADAVPTPGAVQESVTSLSQRFEWIAEQYPTQVAVTDGERQWTYRELAQTSCQIAHELRQRGFDPHRPVAILCGQRAEVLPLLLGVLQAGGFYLPLAPSLPPSRLQTILTETQPQYLLTTAEQRQAAQALVQGQAEVIYLEDCGAVPTSEFQLAHPARHDPACLLYTTGTTGTPRGVVFSHHTILSRVWRYTSDFRLGPDDRIALLQPHAVNAGVRDIFGALLNGATLAVYDLHSRGLSPLPGWLQHQQISVLYTVPTVFRLFLGTLTQERFPHVRIVRLGGEPVRAEDFAGFKAHFSPGCLFVNGYAATETGTICQFFMDHDTQIIAGRMPAGMPVAGIDVQLLDETGAAAVGMVGEVTVEGETLASGTWDPHRRRPVPLTPRPFPTGDLGYQLADGRLFLTGRRDLIVKVHGYRVHLHEVEKAVAGLAGVKEVVAAPRSTPQGDTTIVVYYVPVGGSALPSAELRRVVASALPGSAVPTAFTAVSALPHLPGGKVNRHSLAEFAAVAEETPVAEPVYDSQTVARLAQIWKGVLGVPAVPAEANFFALGGDSIAIFRALHQIRTEFCVEVSIREFFSYATLLELATVIEGQLTYGAPPPALSLDRQSQAGG